MNRRAALLAGALLIAAQLASGQEPIDLRSQSSAMDSLRNKLSIVFDNAFNSYHWNGQVNYFSSSDPLSVGLTEQFLSSVLRADRIFITDQQQFSLAIKRKIAEGLRTSTKVSSFIVSDDRSINLSNISATTVYGGFEYEPLFRFRLEPLIGAAFDKQLDQTDKGISYLLNASIDSLDFGGYRTLLNGTWNYDQIIPRKRETRSLIVSIDKPFFDQTQNSLLAFYSHNRRDIYTPIDPSLQQQYGVSHNIESRTEDLIGLTDTLGYAIDRTTLLSLRGTVAGREIGRDTRYVNSASPSQATLPTTIDEFRLESSAFLSFAPFSAMQTTLRFDYLERDERHTIQNEGFSAGVFSSLSEVEQRKNNHSRRTGLNATVALQLSPSDSINFAGSGNLLRYDTPSQANDDDRDELWYLLGLTVQHRFTPSFKVTVTSEAHLMHLVYLRGTMSANNTWNRVLRLAPTFDYAPSASLFSSNTFEVLANYTVYDYEFASSPVRSFAYRQFSFHDSSTYALTRRLAVVWMNHLKFYEQGQFRWDDFSELPINSYEDKLYIASLRYTMRPGLLFSVGFRYFSQLRYGYTGAERHVDRFLRSTGPSTEIAWNLGERSSWSLRGWYERQRQTGEEARGFTNLTMSFFVHL